MSNTITIQNAKVQTASISTQNNIYSGTLILTDYGKSRLSQRLAEPLTTLEDGSVIPSGTFSPYNLNSLVLGSKINNAYTSAMTSMGEEAQEFPLTSDNITVVGNTARIRTELEITNNMVIQEIGIFEFVNNTRRLFAYASGFSMVKNESLSYNLVIDLELNLTFVNTHYDQFEVSLGDSAYALAPVVPEMGKIITNVHLDLERCIEKNAKALGYFTPQVFMEKHLDMMNTLYNSLILSRYEKIINKVGIEDMTDCFYYPNKVNEPHYSIRNLQDDDSFMVVDGNLQKCNRDNIDLGGPASIVITTRLNSITKNGVIIGKMDPNRDEYYFDFRIVEGALQFTIYSYDVDGEYDVSHWGADEKKLVGHYRIKYTPTAEELANFVDSEVMYTFLYNGDIDNPRVRMFLGIEEITTTRHPDSPENCLIIDNFNFMGPQIRFKERNTLRNYTQTVQTSDYMQPMIYVLPQIQTTTFMAFNREITLDEIVYLSSVSQS